MCTSVFILTANAIRCFEMSYSILYTYTTKLWNIIYKNTYIKFPYSFHPLALPAWQTRRLYLRFLNGKTEIKIIYIKVPWGLFALGSKFYGQ